MAKFNPGDRFRVINPLVVDRVGYDNNLQDLKQWVVDKYKDKIVAFLDSFDETCVTSPSNAINRVAGGIAYSIVRERMRDGQERKIFKSPASDFNSSIIHVVESSRRVKTGKYYGPSYSASDWGYGAYDLDDPGGLTEEKTHILVMCEYGYEFEECDIELIKQDEKYLDEQ